MLTLHPLAPVEWAGYQPPWEGNPGFDLWTLTADIPNHPKGSTISTNTLRQAGYAVPNKRKETPC